MTDLLQVMPLIDYLAIWFVSGPTRRIPNRSFTWLNNLSASLVIGHEYSQVSGDGISKIAGGTFPFSSCIQVASSKCFSSDGLVYFAYGFCHVFTPSVQGL